MKYLVTGGCGFIGSNFIIRCLEKYNDAKIINVDALKIGSNVLSLKGLKNSKYKFVKGNICNKKLMSKLIPEVDYIINFAAESHVDRSIDNPKPFIQTNILGVNNILEILRDNHKIKFVQISTDEIFGEKLKGENKENDEPNPSNPYSATKAAAEMLVKAYTRTYDLDTIITRSVNNYGPRHFPEKLIPKTIISVLKNQSIPIHGEGKAKRQWIHVFDNCDAIMKIIANSKNNKVYHIAGNYEENNLTLVRKIVKMMGADTKLIKFVKDRPGQDRRYAITSSLSKKEFNFIPKISPNKGLEQTINWYLKNEKWWKRIPFKKIKNSNPWIK